MIVQRFLQWATTASDGERSEAANALGRAFVQASLDAENLCMAEAAMTSLLDDPSIKVRRALADAIAASPKVPRHIVIALCDDDEDVAAPVLSLSPVLGIVDLVDYAASHSSLVQMAVAARAPLPAPVAAALAEVGSAEACAVLARNRDAELTPAVIERLIDRHAGNASVREALLALPGLPVGLQQKMLRAVASTLVDAVSGRAVMSREQARAIASDACDRATVVLASEWIGRPEMTVLVQHLRASGQLTTGLLLRAMGEGNLDLFEVALAELSGLPRERVASLVRDRHAAGFETLYRRVGLPDAACGAFRAAIDEIKIAPMPSGPAERLGFKRALAARMLAAHHAGSSDGLDAVSVLLRGVLADASRNEARGVAARVTHMPRLAAA